MAEPVSATVVVPVATTQDERIMAILAHVLQVVGWWIAPLVIFVLKRDFRFTSFHALQPLFLQILYMLLMGMFMIVWFASFFVMMAHAPQAKGAAPPVEFFVLMPMIWLGWMGGWAGMFVLSMSFVIQTGPWELGGYPVR